MLRNSTTTVSGSAVPGQLTVTDAFQTIPGPQYVSDLIFGWNGSDADARRRAGTSVKCSNSQDVSDAVDHETIEISFGAFHQVAAWSENLGLGGNNGGWGMSSGTRI